MPAVSRQNNISIGPGPAPLPRVEIFASQPAFKIQQGKSKTITLIGSVFNNVPFNGTVTVQANSPLGSTTNVACPILQQPFSQHVNVPAGANEIIISVTFFCPATTARGNYNCALRYTAVPDGTSTNVAGGNEVDIGYLVVAAR